MVRIFFPKFWFFDPLCIRKRHSSFKVWPQLQHWQSVTPNTAEAPRLASVIITSAAAQSTVHLRSTAGATRGFFFCLCECGQRGRTPQGKPWSLPLAGQRANWKMLQGRKSHSCGPGGTFSFLSLITWKTGMEAKTRGRPSNTGSKYMLFFITINFSHLFPTFGPGPLQQREN